MLQDIINILYPYDGLSESEVIEIANKINEKINENYIKKD